TTHALSTKILYDSGLQGSYRRTSELRSDPPAVVFDGAFDVGVFFGEPHQLQADGIHQGLPAGFDHVVGDAHRGPAFAVVAPLDEHADVGGSALAGIEHAHLVIGQTHVGDLRVELREALAEAEVQG